jgi:hypothetical protein
LMIPDIAVSKKGDQNNCTWNNNFEENGLQLIFIQMHAEGP